MHTYVSRIVLEGFLVTGRDASLPAPFVERVWHNWSPVKQLGRCPKPHKGRCPLTLQGGYPLDPFFAARLERFFPSIGVLRIFLLIILILAPFGIGAHILHIQSRKHAQAQARLSNL